jgi:hypothetical protein
LKRTTKAIIPSITGKKNHGRLLGFPEEKIESFAFGFTLQLS